MGVKIDHLVVALAALKITQADRDDAKAKGLALSDGSFPCDSLEKLDHAIQSWGRCPPEKRAALKALMNKAANKLGAGPDVKSRIANLSS